MGKIIQLHTVKTAKSMPDVYEALPAKSRGVCVFEGAMAAFSTKYIPLRTLYNLLPPEAKAKYDLRVKESLDELGDDMYEVLE